MKDVFAYIYEACRDAALPVGILPIEVSLVVQPEETADLVAPNISFAALRVSQPLPQAARKAVRLVEAPSSGTARRSGRGSCVSSLAAGGEEPSSVYGPVHSWRFGASLGVDLLLHRSVCSFVCVYCQLGEIDVRTVERAVWVPTSKVERDLEVSAWAGAEVVTFSGSGEPTLAANLGEAIEVAIRVTGRPVVVLTNSAHLWDPAVRRELAGASEVCCKLDAPDADTLRAIDRPVDPAITIERLVAGIAALRVEFAGKLSIQVMALPRTLATLHRLVPLLGPAPSRGPAQRAFAAGPPRADRRNPRRSPRLRGGSRVARHRPVGARNDSGADRKRDIAAGADPARELKNATSERHRCDAFATPTRPGVTEMRSSSHVPASGGPLS